LHYLEESRVRPKIRLRLSAAKFTIASTRILPVHRPTGIADIAFDKNMVFIDIRQGLIFPA
jgi:hypothetical protein